MNWFSWLSKTGLDPSLLHEYALVFDQNELEEEDIVYFNHEFLQSMGVSIAKHRLEILKIARKENVSSPRSIPMLLAAFEKAKKCLAQYVRRTLARHDQETALVVLPRPSHGARWRGARLKRNKTMAVAPQERLLHTNGSPAAARWAKEDGFLGPAAYDVRGDGGEYGYWFWLSAMEETEVRWDTLFQDLRPT